MVNEQASSSKTDKDKLLTYMNKVPVCKFEGITRQASQQFSTEEKSDLLLRYYNTMKARFDGKNFVFIQFLCQISGFSIEVSSVMSKKKIIF